jgi:hypothetical protein
MISWALDYLKLRAWTLSGQSGFASSGQGMGAAEDGVVNVFMGSILGALCGLLGGFILAHLMRYLSYLTGRYLGGYSWVIFGVVAGAVIFGCVAAVKDEG